MHTTNPAAHSRPKRRAPLSRHRRKCAICAHSQRNAIEEAISRFESPAAIAQRFHLGDRRQVYRHAQALGLFVRRNRKLGASLALFLEKSDRLIPTVTNFLHAVEKYAKIDEFGETIRRPKSTPVCWDACG